MTLQDAINHCIEKGETIKNCECANEHLQLAEWLIDLQNLMKNGYSHFTKEMDNNYITFVTAALKGRLSANPNITSEEAAELAVKDAKEVIRKLKLNYNY